MSLTICEVCYELAAPGDRYCDECGHELGTPAGSPARSVEDAARLERAAVNVDLPLFTPAGR